MSTSEEKMRRDMEFIVEQQAQFVVDIQKLQETHTAAEKRMTRLETALVKGYQETTSKINALIESQEGMVQAQQRTDERLNVFITVVERFITEGPNGKRVTPRTQATKKAGDASPSGRKKGGKK